MCKILCKPVVIVAFNETMSFETQRMSSETSGIVGRVVRSFGIQVMNGSAEESKRNDV